MDAEKWSDEMALVIREYVEAKLKPLEQRLAKLEQEGYRGAWQRGIHYLPQQSVTFDGSLWICRRQTTDVPPSSSWSLAVRKGRDAR